jgi:uncharacterized membrane protein
VSHDSALFSQVVVLNDLWRMPLYLTLTHTLALCFWAVTERHTVSIRKWVSLFAPTSQSLARR